jgi:hypothetical protein
MLNRTYVLIGIAAALLGSIIAYHNEIDQVQFKQIDELQDKVIVLDKDQAIMLERLKVLKEFDDLRDKNQTPANLERFIIEKI